MKYLKARIHTIILTMQMTIEYAGGNSCTTDPAIPNKTAPEKTNKGDKRFCVYSNVGMENYAIVLVT